MQRYTLPRLPSESRGSAASDDWRARIRERIRHDGLWSLGSLAANLPGQLSLDDLAEPEPDGKQ
jgi:hypothetical protein